MVEGNPFGPDIARETRECCCGVSIVDIIAHHSIGVEATQGWKWIEFAEARLNTGSILRRPALQISRGLRDRLGQLYPNIHTAWTLID